MVVDQDHGSERGSYMYLYVYGGLVGGTVPALRVPEIRKAPLKCFRHLIRSTKKEAGFRLIGDGLRSTMTEDIVY